ncbi:MAG: MamI family restriction endonuclease [Dolichospermum sp.]|jgi:hypothetical protein|nr:MamI family restriction endonuclease [Anabaena sp. 49628_E55]
MNYLFRFSSYIITELMMLQKERLTETIKLLQIHYDAYLQIKPYADKYGHPHPTDTRAWSQILVSALTGIPGMRRKKGSDLNDGSDVKAANCWDAIDTPRFNGCIKSGTKQSLTNPMSFLDSQPYLFFVMWDKTENTDEKRCRIWVVRTQHDTEFRDMAKKWYEKQDIGEITSNNFQLHPPRNLDHNIFRNTYGNLKYPLLFEACVVDDKYQYKYLNEEVLNTGICTI